MERGVYSVIQTPLDEHENIDHAIFEREINWLIQCGVKGLVLAMVSEVMRFSADERRIQWQTVLKIIDKRVPLIVSVGGESTAIAVRLAKLAEADGATALMATPPSNFPATSEEIFNYYSSILAATHIPLIVQDASNYMGQPLDLEMYGRLIDQYGTDRVQFKPEAKPVKDRAIPLQKIAGGRAKIYEGQSGLELMETHPVGLAGTMPGGEIPWALIRLWDCLEAHDVDKAREIHRVIAQLVGFQKTIDAYVAVEKYLLVKQGIFTSARQRGPVNTILSDEVKKEIDKVFADLQEVTRD
jgi:4-hydroxy-tetrahydrodipicolinate synthase